MWLAGASTDSGSSISIHGIRRPERSLSKKLEARSADSMVLLSNSTAARHWLPMVWCTKLWCTSFRRFSRDGALAPCPIRALISLNLTELRRLAGVTMKYVETPAPHRLEFNHLQANRDQL